MSLLLCRWTFILVLVCWCVGCGRPEVPEPEPEPEPEAVVGEQDSDGDGLTDEMEATLDTSPLRADTDGDGFSDYDEVVEKGFDPANDPYKFNPRIADVPQLGIEISQSPQVHLVYETREGNSVEIQVGSTTDRGWSTSSSQSHGTSTATEHRNTAGGSITVGKQWGLGWHASGTVSYEHSWGTTEEVSVQLSETTTREGRDSLSQMRTKARSTDKSTSGGEILVGVQLHNRGNVQLDVKSLRLIAQKVSADAPDRPTLLGQLELDTNRTFDLISQLKPHTSAGPLMFTSALSLSRIEELLKGGSLVIRVSDSAFAGIEAFTDINAKTATVVIDPGPKEDGSGNETNTYLVAVHSSDGARGISAGEVLREVLHLEYETGMSPWKYGDRESQTHNGLRSLLGRSNDCESNGYWVVSHTTRVGSKTETVDYNPLREDFDFDGVRLRSGH
ncbi:MAG: hypothetical protein ACYSWU_10355, partial [Planctomycetota bacterium]